jgi:hypothetical protein
MRVKGPIDDPIGERGSVGAAARCRPAAATTSATANWAASSGDGGERGGALRSCGLSRGGPVGGARLREQRQHVLSRR